MLAGYLPYADQIEDTDVIIISKDGVHLYQASAAGIGGGLRYWVETKDEIYRVADITALSALTYDPSEPVWKYTWHGAPMSEDNIKHAVYTALDSSGKQPDYILPKESELSKAVNNPSVPINSVNIKPLTLRGYYTGQEVNTPQVCAFDYCRDFNQLYVGWVPINVTNWFIDYETEEATGRSDYIYDLAFEYQHWYMTTPTIFAGILLPSAGSSASYDNDEDLYDDIKSGVLNQWDEYNDEGISYWSLWPNRANYCVEKTGAGLANAEAWINSLRNGTYDGGCDGLMEDCLLKIGWYVDPLDESGDSYDEHVAPGQYTHTVYDRRLGKHGDYDERIEGAQKREELEERAINNWNDAYDPVENPHPGGFENLQAYKDWYVNAYMTSGGGSGLVCGYEHDATTDEAETREIPFIVVASCVGYYPDYQLKPLTGDNNEDIDFPRSKWHSYAFNFPGYSNTSTPGYSYQPSYGETANFSDTGNGYSRVSGTNVDRVLRGSNICVDYKDDNGYVWEIGLFAANSYLVNGDILSTGTNVPLLSIVGNETYNITSLNKIEIDEQFTHWSMNPSLLDNVHDETIMTRDQDSVRIYKYSVLNEGAGLDMIDNARNIASSIVRGTGLKPFKAFEGSQITIRTNIGVNSNEGFRTGLEIVDFDDVTKFDSTTFIDPISGNAWFKGTVTADGGLVQKKLSAGTGITIVSGDKEDIINATGGGGGSVDVDSILALMENGVGITPSKDNINNKLKIDLNHTINVGQYSADYLDVTPSMGIDGQGNPTNERIHTLDISMTNVRNDIYSASHMIPGTGINIATNSGTGQATVETSAISEVTLNGDLVQKTKDDVNNVWKIDLQVSGGGVTDYDIPLPIPDYENRVFLANSVWYTAPSYTVPADGVLYLEASLTAAVTLPVIVNGFTWKLGKKADGTGSRHDSHNMIPLKAGTVVTFGTRIPSTGWADSASQNGAKLWFIPFETKKKSEFDGTTNPYILPCPDFTTTSSGTISKDLIPTVLDSPDWYTWTSTVDGILMANASSTAGGYTICPLDSNDTAVGTYKFAVSTGESQLEHDYFPVRKGKKYKIQKAGTPYDIYIVAYKTASNISDLYAPYLDYANPITKTVTTGTSYVDIWGTGEGDFPARFINNIVGTSSTTALLRVKVSNNGALGERKLIFNSSVDNNSSWPLMPSGIYVSGYRIGTSDYSSGNIVVLKHKIFDPPIAPQRILYNGVNLVDSNGDVDLTFIKNLIDALDQRITALEHNT